MISPAPPRRRWSTFSLRSLFLLVAIFGLWLGVQVNWIQERHEAMNWFGKHHWHGYGKNLTPPHSEFPWSLAILGEQRVNCIDIGIDGHESREDLEYIEKIKLLFPEAEVLVVPNPKEGHVFGE